MNDVEFIRHEAELDKLVKHLGRMDFKGYMTRLGERPAPWSPTEVQRFKLSDNLRFALEEYLREAQRT